ncbi:MAG TPA: MoxR family ATPase [Myxococcota bacterium]|nr:MoxR family ATPase [Myxococcota bacterium]
MRPHELRERLDTLVELSIELPVVIWGPPGVGKSAIVRTVAESHGLEVIDLRLGQLAPTDLRGLPIVADGIARFARPEFLRPDGAGVLFLDELANAVPSVQGLAQELLLDRRIGEHRLGDGWFIWCASNRREDAAAVHAMPAPVANRCIHVEIEPDLDSWKRYAMSQELSADVIAFLSFRPELLYKLDRNRPAFPSPRTWEMASTLHEAALEVSCAVGEAAGDEFRVYLDTVACLPDLSPVLRGRGEDIGWPKELSVRFATCVGLALRVADEEEALAAFRWLSARAGAEWVQLFVADLVTRFRSRGRLGLLAQLLKSHPQLSKLVRELARDAA